MAIFVTSIVFADDLTLKGNKTFVSTSKSIFRSHVYVCGTWSVITKKMSLL